MSSGIPTNWSWRWPTHQWMASRCGWKINREMRFAGSKSAAAQLLFITSFVVGAGPVCLSHFPREAGWELICHQISRCKHTFVTQNCLQKRERSLGNVCMYISRHILLQSYYYISLSAATSHVGGDASGLSYMASINSASCICTGYKYTLHATLASHK